MTSFHLKAENLSYTFRQSSELIFEHINFTLKEGEILGIIGPNGGGKSTLLKLIGGLLEQRDGQKKGLLSCQLNQKDYLTPIAYLPQKENLNLDLPISAAEVIASAQLAKKRHLDRPDFTSFFSDSLIERLELRPLLEKKFNQLSGGQRQRVLMCRALLTNSPLILFDEPTKGLDTQGQDQLMELLAEIKKSGKQAMIVVDHNISQVLRHSDKILCLNRTSHWHDRKELFNQKILNSIYHCEFEHQMIHEQAQGPDIPDHKHCKGDH